MQNTQEKLVNNDKRYQRFIQNVNRYRSMPFSAFWLYRGDIGGLLEFVFPMTISQLVNEYTIDIVRTETEADDGRMKTPLRRLTDQVELDAELMRALSAELGDWND